MADMVMIRARRKSLSTFLTVAAMVLVLLTVTLPWYHVSRDPVYSQTTACEMYIDNLYKVGSEWREYSDSGDATVIMQTAYGLIILWACVSLVYIGLLLAGWEGIVAGATAMFLAILAPLYLMIRLPDAAQSTVWTNSTLMNWDFQIDGFTGTLVGDDGTVYSWGPSIAWFVLLAGSGLQIASVAVNLTSAIDAYRERVVREATPPDLDQGLTDPK